MNSIPLNRFLKIQLRPNRNRKSHPNGHKLGLYPLLIALGLLLLCGTACGGRPEFIGTVLTETEPAPNFQLTDQYGQPLSLADLKGQVVVLTFLYTSCPDICPLIAQKLRQFQQELGTAGQEVTVVAITVDPETDSVDRVRQYSEAMGLQEHWYFLTGSREELDPVWKAYYVAPLAEGSATELAAAPDPTNLAKNESRFAVLHTAPVFLIDRQGLRRLLHSGGDLSVEDLLHDVRLLLEEG